MVQIDTLHWCVSLDIALVLALILLYISVVVPLFMVSLSSNDTHHAGDTPEQSCHTHTDLSGPSEYFSAKMNESSAPIWNDSISGSLRMCRTLLPSMPTTYMPTLDVVPPFAFQPVITVTR